MWVVHVPDVLKMTGCPRGHQQLSLGPRDRMEGFPVIVLLLLFLVCCGRGWVGVAEKGQRLLLQGSTGLLPYGAFDDWPRDSPCFEESGS